MKDGEIANRAGYAGESIPTRATLLDRLRDLGNQEDWKEFYDTYHHLIYQIAVRAGLREAEAQEVVQETVIGVARNLPEFRYDPANGSFKSWLYNLTSWRIADQLRKRDPVMEASRHNRDKQSLNNIPAPETHPEFDLDREWDQALVNVAFERAKERVHPKQIQIFDFYVFQDWPATQIAKFCKVNIAQVYLAKFRVSSLLRRELRNLQKKYCDIDAPRPGGTRAFQSRFTKTSKLQ